MTPAVYSRKHSDCSCVVDKNGTPVLISVAVNTVLASLCVKEKSSMCRPNSVKQLF